MMILPRRSRPHRANRVGLEQLNDDDWEKMVASMEDVIHRGNQGFRGNGTARAILDEILNTAWRVSQYCSSC